MTLILLTEISWTGLHQRPHHFALALAERWTVLWVEPIAFGRHVRWSPEQVEPNVYVMSLPEIPYNARQGSMRVIARVLSSLGVVRTLLTWVQYGLLRRALRSVGTSGEKPGCVLYAFTLIDLLRKFHLSLLHFDYIDNAFGFARFPAHVRDQWTAAVRTADLITVSSPALAKQIEPHRTNAVHYVGNGVEYRHFAAGRRSDCPPDLPRGKPIVGYVGAVYPWLDYQLLREVCLAMKNVDFVFIGPVHPGVVSMVKTLESLPNVRFLGAKPYATIPAYMHHLDVGIIPFQKNELTACVNPVKLYEYSASGLPSVVTDFSEDVLRVKDHIYVASTPRQFASCIRKALNSKRNTARIKSLRSFARRHDWRNKTTVIMRFIEGQMASAGAPLRRNPGTPGRGLHPARD